MALIGYARVSTDEQATVSQTDALTAAGCVEIVEKTGSGGSRARPGLARVGRGDVLVVVRIDRLARSLSHLLAVIEGLEARGAHFKSLHDPIDTATPQGKFALQVLGAAAELARAVRRLAADGLAEPSLLDAAPRRPPKDDALMVAAGIRGADPGLGLRAIAARLEQLGIPTPRGGTVWSPSSVKALLDRAARRGLVGKDPVLPP